VADADPSPEGLIINMIYYTLFVPYKVH